jgi:hypothetical protein
VVNYEYVLRKSTTGMLYGSADFNPIG